MTIDPMIVDKRSGCRC